MGLIIGSLCFLSAVPGLRLHEFIYGFPSLTVTPFWRKWQSFLGPIAAWKWGWRLTYPAVAPSRGILQARC